MGADTVDFSAVRRVLVTKLRHHGDVLLTSPVLPTLKAHAPHLEIDALVYPETAPMLADHPAIARIFTIDRQWKRQGCSRRRATSGSSCHRLRARALRAARAPHRPLARRVAAARCSGSALVGGAAASRRVAVVEAVVLAPLRPAARDDAAHGRGQPRRAAQDRRASAARGREAARAGARRRCRGARRRAAARSTRSSRRSFIQVHPSSRWLFKCWPADRNAALIAPADATTAIAS